MIGRRRWTGLAPLLAVLAGGVLPGAAAAEVLLVRNETPAPLVVQAAAVVRGQLRRDRPHLLQPGDTSPPIVIPGNSVLTIFDAKSPNRVISQEVIPANGRDQLRVLVAGPNPAKVRLVPRTFPRRR